MIAYVIGVLPFIRELWDAHPRVTQPCYADGAGSGGNFGQILTHFRYLQVRGTWRGYLQEPTKSILVVSPQNVSRAEELLRGMDMTVVAGRRHLGRFTGDQEAETNWLYEKVQGWSELVRNLLGCPASTLRPLTQDCRSHSNSSGHSCSGSPRA